MGLRIDEQIAQNPAWRATYARIDSVFYHRPSKLLEIVVGVYADEITAAECPAISTRVIKVEGDDAELILAALHAESGPLVYDVLKAKEPAFSGAPTV